MIYGDSYETKRTNIRKAYKWLLLEHSRDRERSGWGHQSFLSCLLAFSDLFLTITRAEYAEYRREYLVRRCTLSLCELAMDVFVLAAQHRSLRRPLLLGKPAFQ